MLPLRARVNLGVMPMKVYSTFAKTLLDLQIVLYQIRDICGRSYLSAEMQSVYHTAPASWAIDHYSVRKQLKKYLHRRIIS